MYVLCEAANSLVRGHGKREDARRGTGNGISMQPVPRRLSQRARTLLPDAAGGMAGLLCLTTRRGLPFQKLRTENYNSNNNDKETL